MLTRTLPFQTITCCLLSVAIFQSCDPGRILQIKTVNKPNYSVTIYANGNILPASKERQNEKLVLHFPTKMDTAFYYGIGTWHDDKMPEFAKNFDSIIIIRNGVKQNLTSQEDIVKFLLKQRHGFAKSILTIEAK